MKMESILTDSQSQQPGPEMHPSLPVHGYSAQPGPQVDQVNKNKEAEEVFLRELDRLKADPEVDQRWLAIGRTQLEQAFMAINRAIFKPGRARLPEDA
jgi:hypothetical protein